VKGISPKIIQQILGTSPVHTIFTNTEGKMIGYALEYGLEMMRKRQSRMAGYESCEFTAQDFSLQ
jgi:hypothetical protein